MKKISILILSLSLAFASYGLSFAEDTSSSPSFTISRFLIAGSIENREPVGVVNAFSSSTEKVYCYLEANDIVESTTISFVWYYGDKEVATVELPLGKSKRWRTYSSKKLGGRQGEWKVELQRADGSVAKTANFSVE